MAYLDLVVGAEVGVARYTRYGTLDNPRFGRVTKINGYGHIEVDVEGLGLRKFDKYGKPYKSTTSFGQVLQDATHLRSAMAAEAVKKEQARLAHEIDKTMSDAWTYDGRWHANADRIAHLRFLLDRMEETL